MRRDGWPALCIHGDKEQKEREWVLGGLDFEFKQKLTFCHLQSSRRAKPQFYWLPMLPLVDWVRDQIAFFYHPITSLSYQIFSSLFIHIKSKISSCLPISHKPSILFRPSQSVHFSAWSQAQEDHIDCCWSDSKNMVAAKKPPSSNEKHTQSGGAMRGRRVGPWAGCCNVWSEASSP